jgi:hypothetical protein
MLTSPQLLLVLFVNINNNKNNKCLHKENRFYILLTRGRRIKIWCQRFLVFFKSSMWHYLNIGNDFSPSSQHIIMLTLINHNMPCEPLSLLSNGGGGIFPWVWSGWGVRLITHLRLVPGLRMYGTIPPPPYVFVTWYFVKHRGTLPLPHFIFVGLCSTLL